MEEYKSPILCPIIVILAILSLLGGIVGSLLASSFMGVIESITSCALLLGVAQVIDLVGKTAYFTERTCTATEIALNKSPKESKPSSDSVLTEISKDIKWLCRKAEDMDSTLQHLQQLDWLHTIANK